MVQGIKSILVGTTEEGVSESASALGYALTMARQCDAHLSVLATSVRISLHHAVVSDFANNLIAAENRRLRVLADKVAEHSRGEAAAAGVNCTVESHQLSYAELLKSFVAQARVHDIVILDSEAATIDVDRGLIENTLFEGGHPLILVPPKVESFAAKSIVIAWDGSLQAARAVSAALPLLKSADSVELIGVVDEKALSSKVPGADAALWLARHGVKVTETDLPTGPDGIGRTLVRYLERNPADLVVMGAYKHSMFWEWLAGGVTQTLLKANPVPLFLSH